MANARMLLTAPVAWAGTCPGSNGRDGAPGHSAGAATGPACAYTYGSGACRGGGRRGCAGGCCRPAGSKQAVCLRLIRATQCLARSQLHAAEHATDASKNMVMWGSTYVGDAWP